MMQHTPARSTDPSPDPKTPRPLVRHTRREDWGRALMLWESEGKRGYQFEDGELRVIAEPYFELLTPAARPDPVLRHRLHEQAAANGFVPESTTGAQARGERRPAAPRPSLDDQIVVFEALYPDGFEGSAWTEAVRRRPKGRQLKRHRDLAIAEAAEKLGPDALQACLAAGHYAEVLRRVVEVVGHTDLATRQQLSVFSGLEVDAELARAMVGFLHDLQPGDLATMARLRRALARHGVRKLSWTALTAPRALLHPEDHMCVRPSIVRAQAKLVAPKYKPDPSPSADDYARCLELAMNVREHLTRHGLTPRDLFDVTAFMRVTLAPSAKEQLTEAMVSRKSSAEPLA
jgi:hypothetical protein